MIGHGYDVAAARAKPTRQRRRLLETASSGIFSLYAYMCMFVWLIHIIAGAPGSTGSWQHRNQ